MVSGGRSMSAGERFGADRRAQAIQVGAVILLGALVIAFSTYQAVVVPEQNRNVEFNHNQRVQQQLQEVRNGILSAADGQPQATSVELGTARYRSG
jgi:cytochrome c-type biogenesis protein CcmH/NrfG